MLHQLLYKKPPINQAQNSEINNFLSKICYNIAKQINQKSLQEQNLHDLIKIFQKMVLAIRRVKLILFQILIKLQRKIKFEEL